MLMKNQSDVSLQRGLPVEIVADSQSVNQITGETVQLYYYNAGVLTIDAGQSAGVGVIAKLAQAGVLDSIGGKIGTYKNTSFAFVTGTILTAEVDFPWLQAENGDDGTGAGQLEAIIAGFTNGQFCIDYRNGIVYGKKATAGVSDTANYKVAMSTSGGSTSVTSSENIAKVGGTAVPTKGTTPVVPTMIVDASGNQITSFGSPSTIADYRSPKDFTATFTTTSTLTLTGLPFTLLSGVNVVYIKVRKSATNLATVYVNGAGGYSFGYSAGVLTVYKDGTASAVFTDVTDMLEIGINDQQKAYDLSTDTTKVINQSPDRSSYVQDSLADTTNSTGTVYYPSATFVSMDGFKDMSLTGKLIDADATTTMTVECSNDEDVTNADAVQVYGYDSKNNAMVNSIVAASTTTTFAWDFDNLNYSYFRVKVVYGDSTNTSVIKMRRKSL